MNITSKDTMIFKKEYEGKTYYRMGISKKNKDNKYETAYIDIKLPKGVELDNKEVINITKGFMSFYKTKEGKDVFYIVVQEYSKKNEEKKQENSKEVYEQFGNKTEYTADEIDSGMDLPF